MQTQSRFFDDLARVANGALSAAAGVRTEIEQLIRQQFERFLADRHLVSREEFEAVEAMAVRAREEQEKLAARLAELEAALAKAPARKPAAKAAATPAAPRRRAAASTRRAVPRRPGPDETPSGRDE